MTQLCPSDSALSQTAMSFDSALPGTKLCSTQCSLGCYSSVNFFSNFILYKYAAFIWASCPFPLMPSCNKTKTNLTPYGINPVPESTQIVLALSRTKVRMDTKIMCFYTDSLMSFLILMRRIFVFFLTQHFPWYVLYTVKAQRCPGQVRWYRRYKILFRLALHTVTMWPLHTISTVSANHIESPF